MLDALIYTLTHWPKNALPTDQSNLSDTLTSSHSGELTNQNTSSTATDETASQMECTPTTASVATKTTRTNDERFFKRSESILASSGTSESEGDPEVKKSNQNFFNSSKLPLESPNFVSNANFFGGGQSECRFSRPLSETYPLAQQPYLLKPYARKEHLFSSPARLPGETEGVTRGGGDGVGAGVGREGGGEERGRSRRGTALPVSYGIDGQRLVHYVAF